MNKIKIVDVFYLKQDKTIETILLSNNLKEKAVFLYNYQGWFFRVFNNILDIMLFFDEQFEAEISFEDEKELDNYLLNLKII